MIFLQKLNIHFGFSQDLGAKMKDITNTCTRMRRSLTFGGNSLVQWRKVG